MAWRRHLAYLNYVIRHKYYVFQAGLITGARVWDLIVHDLSKFRPSEWVAYSRTFYTETGLSCCVEDSEFDQAWLKHQHRNPHHWQHWVLLGDDAGMGSPGLRIPEHVLREMVADWAGAGRCRYRWDVETWYDKNRGRLVHYVHHDSLVKLDELVKGIDAALYENYPIPLQC